MNKSYVMYDPDTGRGDILHIHPDHLAAQTDGGRLVPLEIDGTFRTYDVSDDGVKDAYDFDVIRRPLLAGIDEQAAARRKPVDDEQRRIHRAKEAEARNLKGPTPYLTAEAKLKGIPVKDLAARVVEKADADLARDVAIEALRSAAKDASRAARSLAEFAAAAQVPWPEGE